MKAALIGGWMLPLAAWDGPTYYRRAAGSTTTTTRTSTTAVTTSTTLPTTATEPTSTQTVTTATTPVPAVVLPMKSITRGAFNPKVRQETIRRTICKAGWPAKVRPPVSYTALMSWFQHSATTAYRWSLVRTVESLPVESYA
jgi:hypothetical protein